MVGIVLKFTTTDDTIEWKWKKKWTLHWQGKVFGVNKQVPDWQNGPYNILQCFDNLELLKIIIFFIFKDFLFMRNTDIFVQKPHVCCYGNHITDIPIFIKLLCCHRKYCHSNNFTQIAEINNHTYEGNNNYSNQYIKIKTLYSHGISFSHETKLKLGM